MSHRGTMWVLIAVFGAAAAILPADGMAQATAGRIVGRVMTPAAAPATGAEVRVLSRPSISTRSW